MNNRYAHKRKFIFTDNTDYKIIKIKSKPKRFVMLTGTNLISQPTLKDNTGTSQN